MVPKSDLLRPNPRVSHVARSSLLIAGFFAVDKILGLFRQAIIGRQFGLSSELDAFNAANNLPDLLFAIISGGALSIALIPVLSSTLEKEGREEVWKLFSRVLNWAFLLTGSAALIFAVLARPIVTAEIGVAPGFTPELQSLVIDLMRINLIATMIFSLSGLASASLQTHQHFLLPALAPIVYDGGQILGAIFLAPESGYRLGNLELPTAGLGVHGLVYGVVIGAILHLAVQLPGLKKYGFRWFPKLGIDHPGLRAVARLMGPRILTIGAFQLIFLVQDNLASRMDVGSVTALTYGWLILQVPETIIATAIGIAILPTLSKFFAAGDAQSFEASVRRALRILLALTIPATVLLSIVLRPFIAAAFGFGASETELVYRAAQAYLLGLAGQSLVEVAARAFYARQDARIPLAASLLNVASFIILSLLLFRRFGPVGIGISVSLAFSMEALFLVILLRTQYPKILDHGRAIRRIVLGSITGGLTAYVLLNALPGPGLIIASLALLAGGIAALPFIWPELRQMIKL
ncbi:MAG: murein biosynthesis integral membrane protein MurJ [Chloroflexi bacterium]|nr:murein biosynthesis integral membrane protein MurJ [Chloroflexota bacterium]